MQPTPPAGPPPPPPPADRPPPPDAAAAASPAAPAPAPPPRDVTAGHGVAILLAAAAVLAAVVGVRASLVSSEASGRRQSSVRQEVKRAAALVEDVRYLYGSEAPAAVQVTQSRIHAEELRRQADRVTGDLRRFLLIEASVHDQIAETAAQGIGLVDDRYLLPSGGYDLGAALAASRARYPDLVSLDPSGTMAAADELGRQAARTVVATIPIGGAFLFGATAQTFRRRRRPLLVAGWLCLAGGAALALLAELAA